MALPSGTTTTTVLSLLQVKRHEATQAILNAKRNKGVSWEQVAIAVGRSPVWVTSCCLGENAMDRESATKLVTFLGLNEAVAETLVMSIPMKGNLDWNLLVQDPTIYRLHEINQIYGLTLKELVQEKFGDGIMSAIDFTMELEKEEDPKGDRVKIVMSGKFLPYKKW